MGIKKKTPYVKTLAPLADTSKVKKKSKLQYKLIPYDETNRWGSRYNGYDYGYIRLADSEYQSAQGHEGNSIIHDGKITKLYPHTLYKLVTNKDSIKCINDYVLDRFIKKSFTKDIVKFVIRGGYYGDESDISIDESFSKSLNEFIERLNLNNDGILNSSLIEETLILEYGYILPELKNKSWAFGETYLNNINPAAGMKHIDKSVVDQYKIDVIDNEYTLTCLCESAKNNFEFRLIDGYHRFAAGNQLHLEKINIIFCN